MIYVLKLDLAALQKVAEGLAKLPFGEVTNLISGIQQEVSVQDRAEAARVATAAADAAVKRAAGVIEDAKKAQEAPKDGAQSRSPPAKPRSRRKPKPA